MSIARTLEGRLSATLALIATLAALVLTVIEVYPVERPDYTTAFIIVALAIIAYKFYLVDKASGKDPDTQKAQLDAAVEMFVEKLAQHRATQDKQKFDNPLTAFIEWISKQEKVKKESEESESSEFATDEEFNNAIKQAQEGQEGEHQVG